MIDFQLNFGPIYIRNFYFENLPFQFNKYFEYFVDKLNQEKKSKNQNISVKHNLLIGTKNKTFDERQLNCIWSLEWDQAQLWPVQAGQRAQVKPGGGAVLRMRGGGAGGRGGAAAGRALVL